MLPGSGLRVVHQIPGRVRIEVPEIYRCPEQAQVCQAVLTKLTGVRECQVNPRSSRILVIFDPKLTNSEIILAALAQGGDSGSGRPPLGQAGDGAALEALAAALALLARLGVPARSSLEFEAASGTLAVFLGYPELTKPLPRAVSRLLSLLAIVLSTRQGNTLALASRLVARIWDWHNSVSGRVPEPVAPASSLIPLAMAPMVLLMGGPYRALAFLLAARPAPLVGFQRTREPGITELPVSRAAQVALAVLASLAGAGVISSGEAGTANRWLTAALTYLGSLRPLPEGSKPEPRPTALPLAIAQEPAGDPRYGLSWAEAERRKLLYGPNALVTVPPPSFGQLLFQQLREPMVLTLAGAAGLSLILRQWLDAAGILAVLPLNLFFSAHQEFRAEQAAQALKHWVAAQAKVLREGEVELIPAEEVVPGDVLILEAGDRVPADALILEANGLALDESALSGESVPVDKFPGVGSEDGSIFDQTQRVFLGTFVVAGRGKACVYATGMQTQAGNIARLGNAPAPESPLRQEISRFSRLSLYGALTAGALVGLLALLRGEKIATALITGAALATAAVPEGLPAMVTLILSRGATRMAEEKALVRRLSAVETLGRVSVVCSDKTGTLTRNQLSVAAVWTPDGSWRFPPAPEEESVQVSQSGTPGERTAEVLFSATGDPGAALRRVLGIGALANNAEISAQTRDGQSVSPSAPPEADLLYNVRGSPTERALALAAAESGIWVEGARAALMREEEIPYDPARALMTVVCRHKSGSRIVLSKGAPEVILRRSTHWVVAGEEREITSADRTRIEAALAELAREGLRNLAVAYRVLNQEASELEDRLTFAGLIGLLDLPRDGVREAVQACQGAGVRVVMITGDHPAAAQAVAAKLGITGEVMSASDLAATSDSELPERLAQVGVLARVSPSDKVRVVRGFQARGEVVAMTGDGVNDAPALRAADVGLAMGRSGSEIAKEVASVVIADDHFATVARALVVGRQSLDRLHRTIAYFTSGNLGEISLELASTLLGLPTPLLPLQILLVNLLSDGPPATAFTLDPAERDGVAIKSLGSVLPQIAARSAFNSLFGTLIFARAAPAGIGQARSLAFSHTVLVQLPLALEWHGPKGKIFPAVLALTAAATAGVLQLPGLRHIFGMAPLSLRQWGELGVAVLTPPILTRWLWPVPA